MPAPNSKPMAVICVLMALALLPVGAQETPATLEVRIAEILLSNYDAKTVDGPVEALAKTAGRSSYHDLLQEWLGVRTRLDSYKPPLNPAYAGVLDVVRKRRPELYEGLVENLEAVTTLGLLNVELCYEAVTSAGFHGPLGDLKPEDLDSAVRQPEFLYRQYALFEAEKIVKDKIRTILAQPEFSVRLAFHIVLFDVLYRIREKTITRLKTSLVYGGQ